ncbi:FAD-dependent oxidoreductase [Microbacteriaceae bacterium K1510]|nr:FAD-dependent oxidoreductase [Microbacteriaceae bacterium K1510]
MANDETRNTAAVAIVGGGPVGMMLALFLDRHGVSSVVFNLDSAVQPHPKGSTHNSRTMEHYRRLGFAHRIRSLGLPADHPTDVAYFTRFNGWELARLRMPSLAEKTAAVASASAVSQVPEPIQRANQMYVEPVLFDEVRRRPNITLRFGHKVESFEEIQGGVLVHSCSADGDAGETWHAQYMVGCDGGRSFVRRSLGISYAGMEQLRQAFFGGRMISTHVRVPTLYREALGYRRAWQYWIVNPEMRTAIVALNGTDEFLLWTPTPDSTGLPSDAAVTSQIARCAGRNLSVEVLAHRPWTAGVALVAERYAQGRVFLAGDSIHLFTPTGGFGMNTGVDDAANLAWKLAAMVQGWGGPSLLATYERERRPIGIRNTSAARQLAKNVGSVSVDPAIEVKGPSGNRVRAELGRHLSTFGDEFASLGVQLGARYDGSPIVVEGGTPPSDNFADYIPSSVPGGRAPHVWLGQGRDLGSSLFDHLGVGFTMLRLGGRAHDIARVEAAAHALGVPFKILDVPGTDARELYGCDLALVRPDQHIAWRGDRPPEDPTLLLKTVTGQLG